MTLRTVINQLKYGALNSLGIKTDNTALTAYVNLGMLALYDRFQLKVSEAIIPLYDHIVEYNLPDDCMVIIAIYDEDGDEFTLNDETNRFGVFQVAYDTIQVANPSTGATLSVIYKSAPDELIYTSEADLNTIVKLPPQLLEPLLHYIEYKAHSMVDSLVSTENNTHYLRYEAKCKTIELNGSIRKDIVPAHVSQAEHISETAALY